MLSSAGPNNPLCSPSSIRGGPTPHIRGGFLPSNVSPSHIRGGSCHSVATAPTSNISLSDTPSIADTTDSIDLLYDQDPDFRLLGIRSLIVDQIPSYCAYSTSHGSHSGTTPSLDLSASSDQTTSEDHSPIRRVHTLAEIGPPSALLPGQAHLDDGSQATTTHHKHLLWNYRPFTSHSPCPVRLRAADGTDLHYPVGHGILRIPANTSCGYIAFQCYHTPSMNSTIISPKGFERIQRPFHRGSRLDKDTTTNTWVFTALHKIRTSQNLSLHGSTHAGLCYTAPAIPPPSAAQNSSPDDILHSLTEDAVLSPERALQVHRITLGLDRILWHQRLGHCSDEKLSKAHLYADGVPKFTNTRTVVDNCPVCLASKTRHQPRGNHETRRATRRGQGFSIDFAFAGQASKDTARTVDYTGYGGETCYVLLQDHYDEQLYGSCRISKAPPLEWLRRWSAIHLDHSNTSGRYIYMDQGGELYKNAAIRKFIQEDLLMDILLTGTEGHHENGVIESANGTVDSGIRNLLHGAGLPIRFWPFAFNQYLLIKNAALPRREIDEATFVQRRGKKTDLSRLRTFGCRVWVKARGYKRKVKYKADAIPGIYLGHLPGGTTRNIVWYDPHTDRVKYAYHCRFDEGMNDLPRDDLPPNVQYLQRTNPDTVPTLDEDDTTVTFLTSLSPFFQLKEVFITIAPADHHVTYGFELGQDDLNGRVYIRSIIRRQHSSAKSLRGKPSRYYGAYIVAIDEHAIFSLTDATQVFARLRTEKSPHFHLTLALEPQAPSTLRRRQLADLSYDPFVPADDFDISDDSSSDDDDPVPLPAAAAPVLHPAVPPTPVPTAAPPPPTTAVPSTPVRRSTRARRPRDPGNAPRSLAHRALHSLHLLHDTDPYDELLNNMDHVEDLLNDPEIQASVSQLLYPPIADLPAHPDPPHETIHALQSEAITDAERALPRFTRHRLKKLDTWPLWHKNEVTQLDQMYDLGMFGSPTRPPPAAQILRLHWQYRIKVNGKRRSRSCCDGSQRAAPALHAQADTFASCLEHPIYRLFIALCAAENFSVFGGDAVDAFAHSPGPTVPTYLRIDDAFYEWWNNRFPDQPLDRSTVIPICRALQGHPEAARLWEEHINSILASIGFTSTTHEKNIYSMDYHGQKVLMVRQVDDFAIGCRDAATAQAIYNMIGAKLQLPGETSAPFEYQGLVTSYNGYDVEQTSSYIKLSAENYITRLLAAHHWEKPSKDESSAAPKIPLHDNDVSNLYHSTPGPPEGTSAHTALSSKFGFSYRSLLGELLFAYVLCRPDIGYAITTLAKFSTAPNEHHYTALKRLALYLRPTKSWGILYWRTAPEPSLPIDSFTPATWDPKLPVVPRASTPHQLISYVDAAHANELRERRSTTGYGHCLSGGVIAYRSKTQPICAQSSTEAELVAAAAAAKVVKYLRLILHELGYPQPGPTPIYEDNDSTIKIVNHSRPTERSRHIDIRYFGLQHWRQLGDLELRHIPGIINPADGLTKALGWVLHSRHCRFMMGHYGFHPT